MSMFRRRPSMQPVLFATSILLGLLWVTEMQALAACPWEYCPLGPTFDCVESYTQYNGSAVTTCSGGGIGDCHGWICWYRDSAGICWNEDIEQCWPWA